MAALERCERCEGAPVLEADETLATRQPAVALLVGSDKEGPSGTLFVTTRCVERALWAASTGAERRRPPRT